MDRLGRWLDEMTFWREFCHKHEYSVFSVNLQKTEFCKYIVQSTHKQNMITHLDDVDEQPQFVFLLTLHL